MTRRFRLNLGDEPWWQQLEHWVFGIALVCMVALGGWWARTMQGFVHTEHALRMHQLSDELRRFSMVVPPTHNPGQSVGRFLLRAEPSPVAGQCMPVTDAPGEKARAWLCITDADIDAAAARLAKRQFMVNGEAGLLLALILVTLVMLFRLVRAQRAFRGEMAFFVGVMTHEMKTPLAGLKSLLQSLRMGRVPDEMLVELVDMGLEQVAREERLVENLLTLQRMRVGSDVPIEPVALGSIVEAEVSSMALTACAVETALDASAWAFADADGVRVVVSNLVSNAAKFGATHVTVSVVTDGEHARLTVADDGRGFTAEEHAAMFGAFRRGGKERGTGAKGSGLGLFLCRQLAHRMGGKLTAQSPGEGRGATFTLRLRSANDAAA